MGEVILTHSAQSEELANLQTVRRNRLGCCNRLGKLVPAKPTWEKNQVVSPRDSFKAKKSVQDLSLVHVLFLKKSNLKGVLIRTNDSYSAICWRPFLPPSCC